MSQSEETFRLPPQVLRTINPEDPHDPVLAQYLPDLREEILLPGERDDPIGDIPHRVAGVGRNALIHRYPDRVLLKITDTCAVSCRFCFRKALMKEAQGPLGEEDFSRALTYIKDHPSIREVILSGGDPLTLSSRRLQEVLFSVGESPHVEIIRIHTRVPVVAPERVDDDVCSVLSSFPKPIYMVIHTNCAQELEGLVSAALKRLHGAGAVLLSQSVLLKGVNDSPQSLEALFRALLRVRVKPYYLHHPDFVSGTSHFRITIKEGQDIFMCLKSKIGGLSLPSYVLDLPGGYGKVDLLSSSVEEADNGRYRIRDDQGLWHDYPPVCLPPPTTADDGRSQ